MWPNGLGAPHSLYAYVNGYDTVKEAGQTLFNESIIIYKEKQNGNDS
jgi:hypothetical protein